MTWFHEDSDERKAHDEYSEAPHKASLTHEVLAGAASYEAFKAYEKHVTEKNGGQPPSHEKAKELLAGFAGAFLDRVVETKGRDAYDAHKKKEVVDSVTARFDEGQQDV